MDEVQISYLCDAVNGSIDQLGACGIECLELQTALIVLCPYNYFLPMPTLPSELQPLFSELESCVDLDEHRAADAVHRLVRSETLSEKGKNAAEREIFVFTLYTDTTGERSEWGTYFRPAVAIYESNGVRTSHPLENVTADVIAYWSARAVESAHPVLRSRYADVAWELAPLVKQNRNVRCAQTAIDAYLARVINAKCIYPTIDLLRRALNLSLALRDEPRVEDVVHAMMDLHARATDPTKVGECIALFDSLFPVRKKVKLSKERLDVIVDSLEQSLRVVAGVDDPSKLDHHAAQRYGERLLKYFRSAGKQDDVLRVTRLFSGAIECMAGKASPMLAAAWLNDAHLAYQYAGMQADAERVLILLKEKGRQSKAQMVSHVTSHTFSAEEVEEFLEEIAGGGVDAAFERIAKFFLPRSVALRNRLKRYREKFPMMSLLPISLVDDDQVTAQVGSIEADGEGRLVHEIAQDMRFWSLFLAHSIERVFRDYDLTHEAFVDLIYRSPLFGIDRYQIITNALRHYRGDDYIATIHVLVPQIEHALRNLLAALQRPTNLHNPKLNAYQEKDLGSILSDEAMRKFMGEDVNRYISAMLTDQRGWNLRNRVSHGLYASHFFARQIADRLIHVLMVISFFRPS